jgi:hypothetical protein
MCKRGRHVTLLTQDKTKDIVGFRMIIVEA